MTERKQWKSTFYSKQEIETIRKYNKERGQRFTKDMKRIMNIILGVILMTGNFALFAWITYFYINDKINQGVGMPLFYYGFIGLTVINCWISCLYYDRSFK